jgi:hypothetical protein
MQETNGRYNKRASLAKINEEGALATEIGCSAARTGDDPQSVQLEAVRVNGLCSMEMVKSLDEMIPNLSSEAQ